MANAHSQLVKEHIEALDKLDAHVFEKKSLERRNSVLASQLDAAQVKIAEREAEMKELTAKLARASRERDTLQHNLESHAAACRCAGQGDEAGGRGGVTGQGGGGAWRTSARARGTGGGAKPAAAWGHGERKRTGDRRQGGARQDRATRGGDTAAAERERGGEGADCGG